MRRRRNLRKWTTAEEQRLLRQVRAFPQNLNRCFLMVSDEIGRTPGACANHWYTVLSKREENLCFFTASSKHVSKNRKNGEGEESNLSIWRRLVNIIKSL